MLYIESDDRWQKVALPEVESLNALEMIHREDSKSASMRIVLGSDGKIYRRTYDRKFGLVWCRFNSQND